MFDELSQWRGHCGSVPDTGRFPDWNAANTSTLTPYGYPYGSLTYGYVAPQLDVTVNSTSYKHNSGDDTMEYETINNKGKVKIKKLSNGFYIDNVVENYNDSGEIAFSTISYSTKTHSGVTIIPGNDYADGKFEKHFKYIVKMPGCSKAEINALIGFDSCANVIEQAYSEIYDGIFLLKDQSFADEENKIIDGIKAIIRCIRNSKSSGNGRNLPMIISKNAGYTAAKLAPENAIIIDTEGIELDCTAEEIERTVDEMTSLVINSAMNDPMETKTFFAQKAPQVRQALSGYATGDRLDVITGMMTVELFLKNFLGIDRYNSKLHEQYLKFINSKGEMIINVNTSIKQEFAAKLSEKFRSKAFKAVNKTRDIRFDDDGRTGIISGNRLLISSAMITTVVNDMPSIKSSESLIEAFKAEGNLICTDGSTHPFDSHDSTGKYQRLYFYDFQADILDEDVLYILQNPETAAFLLTKEESQLPGFMPLISDKSGNIAGKRFIYTEAENDNITLYGQSGEGKSYTKAQIEASRFALGYDILVFDTSDSDTYEAMCANLSKKFVDENVVFHKLDDGGLHVNIFDIDRTTSLPSQKKELVGIIIAAVGDMSVPQTNVLRSVISELLEKTDVDKPIFPDDLLKLLHREGATYASLRNRLEPLIEDIKAYKLTKGTWKGFFDDTHKIVVNPK